MATYLEVVLDLLKNVPNDFARELQLVAFLDQKIESINSEISTMRHIVCSQCDSSEKLSPDEYRELAIQLMKLRHKEREALVIADEKIAVLEELNRTIYDYIDRVDVDLIRYEHELKPDLVRVLLEEEMNQGNYLIDNGFVMHTGYNNQAISISQLHRNSLYNHRGLRYKKPTKRPELVMPGGGTVINPANTQPSTTSTTTAGGTTKLQTTSGVRGSGRGGGGGSTPAGSGRSSRPSSRQNTPKHQSQPASQPPPLFISPPHQSQATAGHSQPAPQPYYDTHPSQQHQQQMAQGQYNTPYYQQQPQQHHQQQQPGQGPPPGKPTVTFARNQQSQQPQQQPPLDGSQPQQQQYQAYPQQPHHHPHHHHAPPQQQLGQQGLAQQTSASHHTYCICKGAVQEEEMVGCDNDQCPVEWYHLSCVGLQFVPEGSWYCPTCKK